MIVDVASLSFRYGRRVALDGVTFDVSEASSFALLGPNGSGKTTLFKILATLLTPSAGTARIDGADVVRQRRRVRACIGVVFQRPSLDGKLSVLENLALQGNLYGLRGTELRRRSDELLVRFELSDRRSHRVETLSGGLQRRVELAKAMLHRPRVLILDEPSTGLDPGARGVLAALLAELRERDGVCSLITTHLTEEADRCDRVGIIDEGRLVRVDAPAALKAGIGGDVLRLSTAEPERLALKIRDRFDVPTAAVDGAVRIERERGHEFVPELIGAFPGEIESVTVGKPTLEDAFFQLTGHRLFAGEERTSDRKRMTLTNESVGMEVKNSVG